MTLLKQLWVAGIVFRQTFGYKYNTLGLAFAQGSLTQNAPHQSVIEGFYRMQLTRYIQFSPDLQLIVNAPKARPGKVSTLLGFRTRLIV